MCLGGRYNWQVTSAEVLAEGLLYAEDSILNGGTPFSQMKETLYVF